MWCVSDVNDLCSACDQRIVVREEEKKTENQIRTRVVRNILYETVKKCGSPTVARLCFDLGTARGIRDFVHGHASYIDLKVLCSGPTSAGSVIFCFFHSQMPHLVRTTRIIIIRGYISIRACQHKVN